MERVVRNTPEEFTTLVELSASNPTALSHVLACRPRAEGAALTFKTQGKDWWARQDSNLRPRPL